MLTRRVIPCLDVSGGRVVKGIRFQGLRDAGDPVEHARWYEATGGDELVILDVSATDEGRAHAVETTAAVREVLSIPLTVGGGVRDVAGAGRLLDAGADKVGVNTAAVQRPELLTEIADQFGRQCCVCAIDAARVEGSSDKSPAWEVVVRGGKDRTGIDAIGWIREAAACGAGEVLLTSWDRDGTRAGYDTALLRAACGAVDIPIIASGGASGTEHMIEAFNAGAEAVLAASIFHERETTPEDVKAELAARGAVVRWPSVDQPTAQTTTGAAP